MGVLEALESVITVQVMDQKDAQLAGADECVRKLYDAGQTHEDGQNGPDEKRRGCAVGHNLERVPRGGRCARACEGKGKSDATGEEGMGCYIRPWAGEARLAEDQAVIDDSWGVHMVSPTGAAAAVMRQDSLQRR